MGSIAKSLKLISRQLTFSRTYYVGVRPALLGSRCFMKLDQNLNVKPMITSYQLQTRYYSPILKKSKPSLNDVQRRVLKVCSDFDKITADKLGTGSHFMNDLGLDSLDHVELIMAIEDEFGCEILDIDAEKLQRPYDIITHISNRNDILE